MICLEELIKLNSYAVHNTLGILLQDKTTKKNIIWATDSYAEYGAQCEDDKQMTVGTLVGMNSILLQPRIFKSLDQQQERTKSKAEVFTPAWLCNKMNNYCDDDWFDKKDVFNKETDQAWETNLEKIEFQCEKDWKKYVDSRRLEITCGEAPFLVSRYDTSTGNIIAVEDRIGVLDRKLRIVNENTNDEEEWFKWTIRAFQSVYGYEYQGDNLLIGRINLLMTFVDNMQCKWNREPTIKELKKIANIIAWNLWQMDGLSGTVPLGIPREENKQMTLFDFLDEKNTENEKETPKCKIYDWRKRVSINFEDEKESSKL